MKAETLTKLSLPQRTTYHQEFSSFIVGTSSRNIGVTAGHLVPHLLPLAVLNSYLFTLYIQETFHSGVNTAVLPCGTFLAALPPAFDTAPWYTVTTFAHRTETIPGSNALLYLNDTLRTQPALVRCVEVQEPLFATVTFPLATSRSRFRDHPVVVAISRGLALDGFCGKIVLVSPDGVDSDDPEHWLFWEIVFGIPVDNTDDNADVIEALPALICEQLRTKFFEAMKRTALLFFDFLVGHGFSRETLYDTFNKNRDVPLAPREPLMYVN